MRREEEKRAGFCAGKKPDPEDIKRNLWEETGFKEKGGCGMEKGLKETREREARDKEFARVSKERIRVFDKNLVSMDREMMFVYKFLNIIMSIFGCFMMIFPVGPAADPDLRVLYVLAWMFLGMAVWERMQPYVNVVGEGRVSKILACHPVEKRLVRQVRREYLRRYLFQIGAVCLAAQQLGALLNGAWSPWNLIYPATVILSLYLVGILQIGWK